MMEKKKYKILIADDEYWTRENLCRMIDWEEYSLECLKPAQDGEEVLERLKEERPDILITDMNMPFVNGVELLATVKEQYPEMVTFAVSGYDDFEYVKGTFMSGAIDYLMKPVTKIDLVNVIVRALQILSERKNEKIQLLKAASLIEDREFSQLIEQKDDSYIPDISINNSMDMAGMSLMLIKIHNFHQFLREKKIDLNWFSYQLKKEIRAMTEGTELIVFNYIYRSNEFIVIGELADCELTALAEKVNHYFDLFPETYLTICISGHLYSIESIHMAYVEAVASMMTRTYCKRNEIILSRKDKGRTTIKKRFTSIYEKRMQNCLQTGNKEALRHIIFDDVGLCRCENEKWSYLEVRQTVRQISNVFLDYRMREQNDGDHEKLAAIDHLMDAADKAVEYLDVEKVCYAIDDIIECFEPGQKDLSNDSMKGIVKRAAAYIDENYYEELTLESLAGKYNVESSYFSRVFRQVMGETLILYITKRRMEKAKEYIRISDENLTEIAFMVGYDDYTYFSRVFKKDTGVSPREYKNSCRREDN